MERRASLADLPYIEFWLVPSIFVLIVGLIALLDSPSACSASCACIETACE